MHFVSRKLVRSTLAAVVAAQLLTSCGSDKKPPTGPDTDHVSYVIESFISSSGVIQLRSGAPPALSSGPSVTVTSSPIVGQGSTAEVVLTATSIFRKIYVSVEGKEDYYEITLPASVTSATLYETFGTSVSGDVTVNYSVATVEGAVGAQTSEDVSIVDVGTGDVQVNVTWDTPTDVDLHVIEPNGEETYYGDEVSTTGGELDLDSNPSCIMDHKNTENITWNSTPPTGIYTVRVDFFDSCDVTAETHYTVTVRRKGRPTLTYSGSFTGTGDAGGAGSGVLVTTFEYP